jgi:hypothetical protein
VKINILSKLRQNERVKKNKKLEDDDNEDNDDIPLIVSIIISTQILNVGISKLGKNEQFFFSKTPQTIVL